MHQKQRHISTGIKYKPIHKFLLGMQNITQILFYFLLITLLCFRFQWQIVLLVFGVRFILQGIDYAVAMRRLKEMDLFWWFPFWDIFQILYNIILFPALIKKPSTQWK